MNRRAFSIEKRSGEERNIDEIYRLYKTLSKLHRSISNVATREELFRSVCHTMSESFTAIWVGWLDTSTQRVLPIASMGDILCYLDKVVIYADERPEGRGPVGTSIREDRVCICDDFQNDERTAPWRAVGESYGLKSIASLPIHFAGKVCGALIVYSKESGTFRDAEVSLLQEAAADISLGLENLDREHRRQKAEKQLKESQAQLQTVLQHIDLGVVALTLDGRSLYWNPAALAMLGFANFEEGIDLAMELPKLFQVSSIDGVPLPVEQWPLWRVLRGESFRNLEIYASRRDCEWNAIFSCGGRIVRDTDGKALLALVTISNVTEQKRAAEALQEREKQLAAILKLAHDGFWLLDTNGNILDANDASSVILSMPREKLLNMNVRELELEESEDETKLHLERMRTLGSDRFDTRLRTGNGGEIFVEMSISYLNLNGGRYVCFCRDIGERKRAENAMREALRLAETAVKTKSEFLANMSHEIRTPMNGIVGMAEILSETSLDNEQQEFLGIIRDSSTALLAIINDILDFSKVEAGKVSLNPEPLPLRKFLSRTVNLLTARLRDRDIEFTIVVDEQVPDNIVADDIRLGQVLINLVGNAIKFTNPGGFVSVRVTQESTEEDAAAGIARLHFAIADSGIGISRDHLATIFDPFTQADASTTRKYGGTGLGLAICSQLVDLMQGKLWAASEEGKGSVFHFCIPVPWSSEVDSRSQATFKLSLNGQTLKVLLVEDNIIMQKVALTMLTRQGIDVDVAKNGKEALERLFSTDRPDYSLILMDVQMPVLNGYATTRLIREKEKQLRKERIPIIAVTADALSGIKGECLEAGMDDYLSKPFSYNKLLEVVDRWGEESEAAGIVASTIAT